MRAHNKPSRKRTGGPREANARKRAKAVNVERFRREHKP